MYPVHKRGSKYGLIHREGSSFALSPKQTAPLGATISLKVITSNKTVAFKSRESVYRVHTSPGKPGKSWNFIVAKRLLVLESSGNLLNSSKKYEMYGRQ